MVGPDGATGGYGAHAADEPFGRTKVLSAIGNLYGSAAVVRTNAARSNADQYLCEFQKTDAAAATALGLLASQDIRQPLSVEATMFLASCARRRLSRAPSLALGTPSPEEILRLAVALRQIGRADRAVGPVSDLLVRAAVAQWLHAACVPVDALLNTCAASASEGEADVALAALAALPEEANTKEVKIDRVRPQVLLDIAEAAPRVLEALGGLGQLPDAGRIRAAIQWLSICDASAVVLAGLATTPLLVSAGQVFTAGPPGASLATEFLERLLDKSSTPGSCPEPLVNALLQLLGALQPVVVGETRGMLCNLVGEAVMAWRRFFVQPSAGAPAAAWVSLLEGLLACVSWGHTAAAATLPAWLGLFDHVQKVGAGGAYTGVLLRVVGALRAASEFPSGFELWAPDERDSFVDYRRELRDSLRSLVGDTSMLRAVVSELSQDVASRLQGPWAPLEESLHALSSLSKNVVEWAAQADGTGAAAASGVREILGALTAGGGPVLGARGHRQLVCTFLMCASMYAPLLETAAGPASASSLLVRVFEIARASLSIPESIVEGPDAAHPLRVKQDHMGAVCLLRLCGGGAGAVRPEQVPSVACVALRSDLLSNLSLAATSQLGQTPLEDHSLLVVAQAAGFAAIVGSPQVAHSMVVDCLAMAKDSSSGSSLALHSAAEIISKCARVHGSVIANALETASAALRDVPLEAKALASLLVAVVEHGSAESIRPVVQLVATVFMQRPDARASLFDVVASLCCRAGREADETMNAFVAELVHGVSVCAWSTVDAQGVVSARLQLLADTTVRPCGAIEGDGAIMADSRIIHKSSEIIALNVSPEEHAIIEAWARVMHEAGKRAPVVLAGGDGSALLLALRASISLLAVPCADPPARVLGFLGADWAAAGGKGAIATITSETAPLMRSHMCIALRAAAAKGDAADARPWELGALVFRGVMKALLGQMPASALALVVPAARGLFQYGDAAASEAWLRRAAAGEDFPQSITKADTRERFIKEVIVASGIGGTVAPASAGDTQKFKQALKRYCGGKKKGDVP